eukprot:2132041-Rhodomonas_salina.2
MSRSDFNSRVLITQPFQSDQSWKKKNRTSALSRTHYFRITFSIRLRALQHLSVKSSTKLLKLSRGAPGRGIFYVSAAHRIAEAKDHQGRLPCAMAPPSCIILS